MEIAVMADIHGNYVAFERCMEYCRQRGIDTYIFLGDYAGEMAFPEKAMEMLFKIKEKYRCYFVRGNKEDYWKNYRDKGETGWKEYDSTTGSLYYTYYHLSQKSMDFSDKSMDWTIMKDFAVKYAFISLPYDVERVIRDLHEAGLDKYAPCWYRITEYLLRKGDISHGRVLNRAMELCKEKVGDCIWPNIPEEYWCQAVKEMIG